MLFFVPDTHFRHARLIESGARPANFEAKLMASWRNMVGVADTVVLMGDVGFGDCSDILSNLPGLKMLVRGNHDHGSDTKFAAMGFCFVCDEFAIRMRNRRVLVTHCPMYGHGHDINVHGHLHSLFTYPGDGLRLPLALEASDYAPIAVDEHFEKMVESFCRRFDEQGVRPSAAAFAELHLPGKKSMRSMSREGFFHLAESDEKYLARTSFQAREEMLMARFGARPRKELDAARTLVHRIVVRFPDNEDAFRELARAVCGEISPPGNN